MQKNQILSLIIKKVRNQTFEISRPKGYGSKSADQRKIRIRFLDFLESKRQAFASGLFGVQKLL